MGAFQVLFGLDQGNDDYAETISMVTEENGLHSKDVQYVKQILEFFLEHKSEIDRSGCACSYGPRYH